MWYLIASTVVVSYCNLLQAAGSNKKQMSDSDDEVGIREEDWEWCVTFVAMNRKGKFTSLPISSN